MAKGGGEMAARHSDTNRFARRARSAHAAQNATSFVACPPRCCRSCQQRDAVAAQVACCARQQAAGSAAAQSAPTSRGVSRVR